MDRAYTVKEIDALRRVHQDKLVWGLYSGPAKGQRNSFSYNVEKMKIEVEDRVRTSMLAGHTAEDLLTSERGE